jgi:hypothetical protein
MNMYVCIVIVATVITIFHPIKFILLKDLMWYPEKKRIASLPFFHGCHKRRIYGDKRVISEMPLPFGDQA